MNVVVFFVDFLRFSLSQGSSSGASCVFFLARA